MNIDLTGMIARSTASGWALCAIGLAGLFGIWRLYMIARPKMAQIEQDGEEKLRHEMWADIAGLKAAKSEMGARLTLAESKIATQQVEIGQQRFILNLVITELENVSPGNAIARQARILMDHVQPAAFGEAGSSFGTDLTDKLAETGAGE